ncbi:MAG: hypothetical protein IPN90_12235 [Elusimicrobia bacterium]|nr:hypothetical protein [Elusimicrobiota bacterium]
MIPLDSDYYEIHCTTQAPLGTTVWWEFRAFDGLLPVSEYRSRLDQNGDHKFTVPEDDAGLWSAWTPIPPAGGLFLGRFSKTFVSGTVRGRVTVVSLCPNGCNQQVTGTIEVVGPRFGFPAPQLKSDATSSIYLFSNHGFYLRCPVATEDLTVSACLYADNPLVNLPSSFVGFRVTGVGPGKTFIFYGSWNNVDGSVAARNSFNYDENLRSNTGPGVPERPVILSWRRFR